MLFLGPRLFITSSIDSDHHLAMQSDFKHMLKEIQNHFQDPAVGVAPCEALQALDETLASLNQIKKSLEEIKEYRAAQAEKEMTAKDNRVPQLQNRAQKSKAAAEGMLGYPLMPEHFASGGAYALLPVGFVERPTFEAAVQSYPKEIARLKEVVDQCKGELDTLKSPSFKSRGCVTPAQASEQVMRSIRGGEVMIHDQRSRLLSYMETHKPMLDAHFGKTLAGHLDAMLDAYLELEKLEQSELKT
jgi:hypothetical protein